MHFNIPKRIFYWYTWMKWERPQPRGVINKREKIEIAAITDALHVQWSDADNSVKFCHDAWDKSAVRLKRSQTRYPLIVLQRLFAELNSMPKVSILTFRCKRASHRHERRTPINAFQSCIRRGIIIIMFFSFARLFRMRILIIVIIVNVG